MRRVLMSQAKCQLRKGFTLVELLVVIAIIGILVSLLLPAVQAAREAARRMECSTKVKQLALALHNYHGVYGRFPAGSILDVPPGTPLSQACKVVNRRRRAPWTVAILPYLEQQGLYDQIDFTAPFVCDNAASPVTGPNRDVWRTELASFKCPSFALHRGNHSNYFGVMGGGPHSLNVCESKPGRVFYNNGILFQNSDIRFADVLDGTSNTFLVVETKYQVTPSGRGDSHWLGWASTIRGGGWSVTGVLTAMVLPINVFSGSGITHDTTFATAGRLPPQGMGLHQRSCGSFHPGGCHVALADAAVRFVNENIDLTTYQCLGIRHDGEAIQAP